MEEAAREARKAEAAREAREAETARKRRRRAVKYLLEEIRQVAFTEEQIKAAISESTACGSAVDYFSIFNKIKLPDEPERAPLPPLSARDRKRLERQRKEHGAQPMSAAVLPSSAPLEDIGAGAAENISAGEMPTKSVDQRGNLAIFESKA